MSIIKAIEKAYEKAEKRGWDNIYFAIDIHDTIIKSNYQNGGYEFINDSARYAMQLLTTRKEVVTILWSSMSLIDMIEISEWLSNHDIFVEFLNANPLERNTNYACFDKKFYFSVLLDDKAGFDPDVDWDRIIQYYKIKDNPYVSGRNV